MLIRIRAKFLKGNELKFLSHLDILRTYTRAIRRSNIPVAYSQGFNPHMLISFGLPLSVGNTSEGELTDIDLQEDMDIQEFIAKINLGLPEDLKVVDAQKVELQSNIMSIIKSSKYKVSIFGNNLGKINEFVEELINKPQILIEKKTKKGIKEVDIKNKIIEIKVISSSENNVEIFMHLDAGSESNLKPDLIVDSLRKYYKIEIDDYHVHRIELIY